MLTVGHLIKRLHQNLMKIYRHRFDCIDLISGHGTHYCHDSLRPDLLSTFLSVVRVHEICPANFGNVWRRAVVKFNQMSGEKLEMSSEAQNNFAYSGVVTL